MASSTSPGANDELATAVGQYVLGEISLGKAHYSDSGKPEEESLRTRQ
jgi:hypothetical protein